MDIEPGLHDYWRVVQKRRWVIVAVAVLVALAAAINAHFKPFVFRAAAMIKFEPPGLKIVGMDMTTWDQFSAMQTQMKILSSEDMGRRVAARAGKIRGAYRADRVGESNLISIAASAPDAQEAARIANAVVDAYMERDMEERSLSTRKALEDINLRRDEVEVSLRELEERRKDYLQDHKSAGLGQALTSSLMELETRRRELLKKFTVEHPEVIALDQRTAAVKARLEQVPIHETDLERINRDMKVNEELYVALSRQLEETKITLSSMASFVAVVSRANPPARPSSPNKKADAVKGLLFGILLGLAAALILESLDISISTIEDIEKVLGIPVLGVIPHLGTAKKWEALRSKLLRRQRYPMDVFRSLLIFQKKPKSPEIEVYHSLRSAIQAQSPERKNWVMAFTSTGVAEGKTLTAVNFCLAAAHVGLKTLLIGADVRRPVLYRIFGLPRQAGFVEVLSGKASWRQVTRETVDFLMGEVELDRLLGFPGVDNFKVITGFASMGSEVVNLFSSESLPRFIAEVRPHFDLVVFDCPPVLLFVDSVLIGAHTDGVVMVYKAGKMARQALRRAKDQLVASKVNILGVVLNDMSSMDMEPRYGAYYDYGHYAKKEEA